MKRIITNAIYYLMYTNFGEYLVVKEYKKVVQSDPDLFSEIEDFILQIAAESNLPEKKMNNLALAVDEASANSMVHGNKRDKNKFVEIYVQVFEDRLEITFKDQGNGFNPQAVPDPTNSENILKESGRGIHIMRSFLDDLKFNFTPSGTEVTLVLNF
ncbi:MAG: ATP-binding protein [Bacteroidetes bacterium]|nr:ATP-binding protein [Bacteroidota bacterium]MBU1681173.1 ATP-binding protein [Bacteroidota bacterium]